MSLNTIQQPVGGTGETNPLNLAAPHEVDFRNLPTDKLMPLVDELFDSFKRSTKFENRLINALAIQHIAEKKRMEHSDLGLDIRDSIVLTKFLVEHNGHFIVV